MVRTCSLEMETLFKIAIVYLLCFALVPKVVGKSVNETPPKHEQKARNTRPGSDRVTTPKESRLMGCQQCCSHLHSWCPIVTKTCTC